MTPSGKTVCLCMIVKDEAAVIRRCLASVRPLVDAWLIVDTGSTDGTQDLIRAAMADLPGRLAERPWVDFGTNRTEALALARPLADYSLIIDADDEYVVPPGFVMPELDADAYEVDIDYGAIAYRRLQLLRNALVWRYRGVLHEFPDCPEAATRGHLPVRMRINHEGRRSTDPTTYARDAAILEKALETEADPFLVSRYTFYLAQSRRDSGDHAGALAAYLKRAELGFWQQEVYVSLYEAARRMEILGRDVEAVSAAYRRATAACPERSEAAHAESRYHRLAGRFEAGYAAAKAALGRTPPPDGLFVEPSVYAYGLLDELAVNAYWTGRYRECLDATLRALQSGKVPEAERPRLLANMRFALDKLPTPQPSVVAASDPSARGKDAAMAPSPGAERTISLFRKQFRIFRTIHIVWVGDESRRPDNCIETWRRMNPDWNVVVWGNRELEATEWQNRAHINEMWGRELNGVADMMRWEILDRHGGFAVDADSICVRPLEDWLFEPEIFACWENEIARPGLVAAGYVYAHPGNALIRRVIADIQALPEVSSKRAWELVGPQRLTDAIHAMAYPDITIYPSHFFIPEHLSGLKHGGRAQIFAEQFWASTKIAAYEGLHRTSIADVQKFFG